MITTEQLLNKISNIYLKINKVDLYKKQKQEHNYLHGTDLGKKNIWSHSDK